MGELCPSAVLEPAAVPPPLDLFPWSPPIEPGAHRPAPPELPDHEDLSRTGSGLCPGAVLEPAAVPPPRFRGPRIHPRAPAD